MPKAGRGHETPEHYGFNKFESNIFSSLSNLVNYSAKVQSEKSEEIGGAIGLLAWRHFVIGATRHITAAELHKAAARNLNPTEFRVKRIAKGLSRYLRLSVSRGVEHHTVDKTVQELEQDLRATAREQAVSYNPEYARPRGAARDTISLLTLNVNGSLGKMEEVAQLAAWYKPDILCLQETRRSGRHKCLHIRGYQTCEVLADGAGGTGLALCWRLGSGLTVDILNTAPDCITAKVVGADGAQLVVGCVYRGHSRELRAGALNSAANELRRHANTGCVLSGDWNTTPHVMARSLRRKGCQAQVNDAPRKGTRVGVNLGRTARAIDYAIASSDNIIIKQRVRTRFVISDHWPVEVTIRLARSDPTTDIPLIFDRTALRNPATVEAIRNHNYGTTPAEVGVELSRRLTDLKVIRPAKCEDRKTLSRKLLRAIEDKRRIAKLVRTNQAHISAFRQLSSGYKSK